MVIRTKMTSQRYAMGSSDPFPAGFEIQFGSLNFQATVNDYLMHLTNRDELHPWRSSGPGLIPAAPTTDAPAPELTTTETASTSQRRRHSSQRLRQARAEQRRAARTTAQRDSPPLTDTTTLPVGEHTAVGPQFPHGMRNSASTYTSSVSTDMAAYEQSGTSSLPPTASRTMARQANCHPRPRTVRGVGLLRRTGPRDVPAIPRHRGLLVRLLRRLQHWKL
jgi:hypothetical protein